MTRGVKIEGAALVFEVALGGFDQVGDEVVAALELNVDLGEGVFETVAERVYQETLALLS